MFEKWWETQFYNENLKHLFKMGWDAGREHEKQLRYKYWYDENIIKVKEEKDYRLGWFKTDTLEDGWYWWRAGVNDYEPEVLEVVNGVIVDSRPADSYGAEWEVYEHEDFSGLWSGPIKVPA